MKAKTPTEVLKAAKWILENVGWIKDRDVDYVNLKPIGFCALGALKEVEREDDKAALFTLAVARLQDAMECSVCKFNDSPVTTKEDVIKAFDRAIERS